MIELAYAETSDGPRIIFYGPTTSGSDFLRLKGVFERLRNSESEISLSDLPFVLAKGSINLDLIRSPNGGGVRRVNPQQLSFEWSQSIDEWDDDIARMEGFSKPGQFHQYLGDSSTGAARVVVSMGEYPPGHFSKNDD